MFSNDDDNTGLAIGVVFGVVAAVLALVIGIAISSDGPAEAPKAAAPAVAAAAADGPSVKVEGGVVKFYFASGKADLAASANEALAETVKGVQGGKKALVSGFHDTTGDPAKNEELAKQRAFAVRDALKALGVAEDRIELKKPEVTAGSGDLAEARRVEVTLQ